MNKIKDIIKENELTSRILDLMECREDMTQSDIQGAIQAIIMDAFSYARGNK